MRTGFNSLAIKYGSKWLWPVLLFQYFPGRNEVPHEYEEVLTTYPQRSAYKKYFIKTVDIFAAEN
jgi:hypothetical protein